MIEEAKEFFEKNYFIPEEKRVIVDSQKDLIDEVISKLKKEGCDYSKNAVIFPGKRPAYYLIKRLARESDSPLIPPAIFSIDEFIDFVFEKIDASASIEAFDAVGIIYEICKDRTYLSPFFQKFDNFISYGFRLFRLFEELYIEGVSYDKLREIETLIEVPYLSSQNIRALSDIYGMFYKELKQRKLATRSLKYKTIAENEILSFLSFESIIFAGFYALTYTEKEILGKITKHDNFNFIFQQRIGFSEEKIKIYCCSDLHGEVKIAGKILKEMLQKEENLLDEGTAIVLPSSDSLFPLLRQGIPYINEENYNISMGYPLRRTPIFGFFISLFELISSAEKDRFYVPLYLKFLLHPYTKNILYRNNAELSRIILHEIEDYLTNKDVLVFVELEMLEKEIPKKIVSDLINYGISENNIYEHLKLIHDNTIRRFLSVKNIEDFMSKSKEVLLFIYERSTARLHPLFYPYVESFLKEFDKFAHSFIGRFSFEEIESYFNFFKNVFASTNVPLPGTPLKGLQIIGFLETRSIKFKRVIFLDLNEDTFPAISEDYLLPYAVRKILGLPAYQDTERLIYHYFSILIEGTEEAHLIYIKNDRQERSRFIEKLIWELEKKKGARYDESKNLITLSNYRLNLANKFPKEISKTEEVMKVIEKLTLSATSLDEYLECGIRFYYSNILRLKKRQNISADIERSEIGTIVHDSLRDYFKDKIGKKLRASDFISNIEDIVNRFFLHKYGDKTEGKSYMIKIQILKRLGEVINYYREICGKVDFHILSVEDSFEEKIEGRRFKCRIDRVDRVDDKTLILDYKITGMEENFKINFDRLDIRDRTSWRKAISSLQIPLYMILYSNKYGLPTSKIQGSYVLLGKYVFDSSCYFRPISEANKHEEIEILQAVIEGLIKEIEDPAFPFMPPEDFKNACRICDYKSLCGTLTVPSNTSSAGPVI